MNYIYTDVTYYCDSNFTACNFMTIESIKRQLNLIMLNDT